MRPTTARWLMTLTVSAVAIAGIIFVNSRYHGDFLPGVWLIVAPVWFLAVLLPRVLPVRCQDCGGRMRFGFRRQGDSQDVYFYECARCAHRHEWEGSSSPASLDS